MRILIIGGTSGIGWALAEHYLQAGHEIGITGRDIAKVNSDACKKYVRLQRYQFDVTDQAALISAIHDFSNTRIDLLIVSAGFYFNDRHHRLDEATTLQMLQTNVTGLNQAFELAAAKMLLQKSGHLVAIASMAGVLKDYHGASLYSATKRSVIDLCNTYRKALAPFSISVTTIVPGYIDTEKLRQLNNGDASHKPFLLSEQQALSYIVKAIAQHDHMCAFPWQMRWLIRLLNFLPKQLLRLRK
jgi:NADP-dependent 3-hydroxy acid dehydrogenase YdfG